jgi:Cu-Zn family superoxide dismutase
MKPSVLAALTAVGAIGFSALSMGVDASVKPIKSYTVPLQAVDGSSVGQVTLTPGPQGLEVRAEVQGLTEGFHGFHLHEKAVCDGAGVPPFSGAGGHYRTTDAPHGGHAGDLPPLMVNEDGRGVAVTVTDNFGLKTLLRRGGAFVVHAAPDNLAHIPVRYRADGAVAPGPDAVTLATGDGGARVACGAISG